MKCPNCQFDNPDGMKFCGECGCEIKSLCPQCHFKNPHNFKYCGECGAQLAAPEKSQPKELSPEDKLDKLQRYLPKGVTEKILAQRGRIEGERKHITVLFCDLLDFTPMVEKLGYEDAYSLMDQVYEILIHKVHEYGGTVNEMTGDGVMALFGAPIALEDAPQRAIRSAMSIHRAITSFSNEMQDRGKDAPSLKMRIGINTGHVVVGTLGNDLRVEFKAVGDTVNLASRMEGLAEPGTTYVTEDTFKLAEGFFRFESVGAKKVKGIKNPVKVYRVIAASSKMTRFDVSAERGLTPLVGRERELDLLRDAFERAKAGRGQAVSIISEAGVGKSRLLYEFRKSIANETITLLEGKCASFTKGIAYYPIKEILQSNFNVEEGDEDSLISDKVTKGLQILKVDEADTLPFLLEVLGVKDSGIQRYQLSPDGLKNHLIEALVRIVIKGSEIRPLIMAFEDLHWLDSSSEEALRYLLESIPGSRVLLLFTFRPEFTQPWGTKSYHSQIMLNRLAMLESAKVATHLLEVVELDSPIEALIHEKTEGVPFFIEEFTKSLKELNIIEVDRDKYIFAKDLTNVVVPTTIQDVIMARVDRLPEKTKNILQIGSAIGREFSFTMINSLTDFENNQLLSNLSHAKTTELIYERGLYPNTVYIFKHALTQDVIYQSILTKKRKDLHGMIAKAIEKIYANAIEDQYGVLSEHFFLSEDFEEEFKYSKLAAIKAQKSASLNDAIYFTNKCISALEKLPQSDETELKIIDNRTTLAVYQVQLNYFVEAKISVDPIIELAHKYNYKKRLAQIYFVTGVYESHVNENYDEASKNLDRSIEISGKVSDTISMILANNWTGWNSLWNCQFEKSFRHFRKALEINEMFNNMWGIAAVKGCLGSAYFWNGKIDNAYNICNEAIEIADKSGDIYSKAFSYTNLGIACFGKGYLEQAIKCLIIGSDYCNRINLHMWVAAAQFSLAEIYFELNDLEKSETSFAKAASILEKERFNPSMLNQCLLGIEGVKAKKGNHSIDVEHLYAYCSRNKAALYEGWLSRNIAEIYHNFDKNYTVESVHWIERAIEADTRNDIMFYLGIDYTICAKVLKRQNNHKKARETLYMAKTIFNKCGADGWVEKTEKDIEKI